MARSINSWYYTSRKRGLSGWITVEYRTDLVFRARWNDPKQHPSPYQFSVSFGTTHEEALAAARKQMSAGCKVELSHTS